VIDSGGSGRVSDSGGGGGKVTVAAVSELNMVILSISR
jgi:hypothetical protein